MSVHQIWCWITSPKALQHLMWNAITKYPFEALVGNARPITAVWAVVQGKWGSGSFVSNLNVELLTESFFPRQTVQLKEGVEVKAIVWMKMLLEEVSRISLQNVELYKRWGWKSMLAVGSEGTEQQISGAGIHWLDSWWLVSTFPSGLTSGLWPRCYIKAWVSESRLNLNEPLCLHQECEVLS